MSHVPVQPAPSANPLGAGSRKAHAGLVTPLLLYGLAKLASLAGIALPEDVLMPLAAALTGLIVWLVPNAEPSGSTGTPPAVPAPAPPLF